MSNRTTGRIAFMATPPLPRQARRRRRRNRRNARCPACRRRRRPVRTLRPFKLCVRFQQATTDTARKRAQRPGDAEWSGSGSSAHDVAEDDDVHVQRPGTPADFARTVVLAVQRRGNASEFQRGQRGLYSHDHVQEVRLALRTANGLGLHHRGHPRSRTSGGSTEVRNCSGEGVVPLPQVAAEGQDWPWCSRMFMIAPGAR